MKRNHPIYLRELSRRTIAYLLLTVLFLPVLIYSCRKIGAVPNEYANPPIDIAAVITKDDLLNWYDQLPAPEQNDLGNEAGLKNGTGKLPFPLQWDKAQQRILNGKHVVRVPVSKDAVMMFVKEGRNGVINAYSYKWLDKTKNGEDFSGEVIRFSFQDFTLHHASYLNGKAFNFSKFVFRNALTPDQIAAVKKGLVASKGKSGGRKIIVADFDLLSWLAGALNTIGNTIGSIGCTLLGGTWDNGDGGSASYNRHGSFSASCPLDGSEYSDTFSGGISDMDYFAPVTFTITNSKAGGSSSGGSSSGGSSSGGSSSGGSSTSYTNIDNLSAAFWSRFSILSGGIYNNTIPVGVSPISYDLDPNVRNCVGIIAGNVKIYAQIGANIANTFGLTGNQASLDVRDMINIIATTPNHRLSFIEDDQLGDADARSLGISIHLNPDYLDHATDLSVARTIIHEMVHTYFLWNINNGTFNPNSPSYTEFQAENQVLFTSSGGPADVDAQHMQIAQKYVSGIGAMLYAYAQTNSNIAVPSWYTGTLSDYCKDLAWGGLQDTRIYNALSSADRNRIEKAVIAETNDPQVQHETPTLPCNCH